METKEKNSRQGNKRIALLLVLKALEQMSDEFHPIKQVTLAKMVNDIGRTLNLDIWCDRKTIGRHLKMIGAVGNKIIALKGKGCYLESSKFTKEESEIITRLITDSQLTDDKKSLLSEKILLQQRNINIKTFSNNLK